MNIQGDGVIHLREYLSKHIGLTDKSKASPLLQDRDTLTIHELRLAITLLQQLRTVNPAIPSIRKLLSKGKGSSIIVPKKQENDVNEINAKEKVIMDARKKKLIRLDEEMRYGKLINNVRKKTAMHELESHTKSARQHMAIGANMIIARLTVGIAVYMISRSFTNDETYRVLAGLMGAILMMIIEMILHIVRAHQYERLEKRTKRANPGVF